MLKVITESDFPFLLREHLLIRILLAFLDNLDILTACHLLFALILLISTDGNIQVHAFNLKMLLKSCVLTL